MTDHARVMLLERFNAPLAPAKLPVPEPESGGLIVRVAAAGVCGSDLEIAAGMDPRITPEGLPLILGHEGVGRVEQVGGTRRDLLDAPVEVGDLVVWNRGTTCGRCYQCSVKRRRALCPHRQVYGISLPARAPTWLNGCFAQMLYVRPGSEVVKLDPSADPVTVVPATCSGATAAHAIELADICMEDRVLVIGPGPLGIYAAAFALVRGARDVVVAGTERSRERLSLAREMGCGVTLSADLETGPQGRFDVVLDAAGTADSVSLALRQVGVGGAVLLPGVASPIGQVPVEVYEQIARRHVRLQGVWVSDARHLWEAVSLAISGRFPLDRLVTHRFPLEQANEALEVVRSRAALKAVLVPAEG